MKRKYFNFCSYAKVYTRYYNKKMFYMKRWNNTIGFGMLSIDELTMHYFVP